MESDKPIADLMQDVLALYRAGQFKDAHAACLGILDQDPTHFDALQIAGGLSVPLGDPVAALELLTRAVGVNPSHAASHYNRGNALMALGQHTDAVASYDRALAIKPRYAAAYNNRGAALRALGQLAAAAQSFAAAFAIRPDDAEAYNNHGMALMELGKRDAALKSYDAALAIRPDFANAHSNRGAALLAAKQFSAAADSYDKAIALDAGVDFLHGQRLFANMCACDWRRLDAEIAEIQNLVADGKMPALPFPVVAAIDSPGLQGTVAERAALKQHPARGDLGPIPASPRSERIRVAYVSGDFHDHPMPRLMAEVFECHDRSAFEITALSFGPDLNDSMRARLTQAFDRFVDVRAKSDQEIAALSRDLGIDIAVDLSGYTTDSRPGIFAFRAAPVQAGYIGYLGTMATPYHDYLIADAAIIPIEFQKHYTEKIVTLPSYQANDSKRVIADTTYTREDVGLPPTGFVFCCFNNNYKITPAVFDSWMRILRQVQGSVLLLFAGDKTIASNLTREAAARGIDAGRIVFCKALPAPEYMARLRVADLFLDTRPYNAGTTASDALWAGLPVLTCVGDAFASRMAGSLLNAVGLPELITRTPAEYEARALDLATHPAELAGIKQRLQERRLTCALFNTGLFTGHLEAAYRKMHERARAGLIPDHIHI